ncbi:MAG: penicillin-binding protein [Thermoleophilaceae bacterium]|nr:penicillin-binding protein [Thermoleophilaceae bacterium]
MNRQIARLFVGAMILILVLAVFTARWTVLEADALKAQPLNRRPLLEQQQIPRGLILARDNSKLAINRRIGTRQNKRYYREYPTKNLFSHGVGYAFVSRGASGLEQYYNDVLSGTGSDLSSFIDEIAGGAKQGDDLKTTLDPVAQKTALDALGANHGAIVALDPRNGAVQVMASKPDYDPNQVPSQYKQLNDPNGGSPLFNRATQGQYPPGSTFKVVTAAAALDSGQYTPTSVLDGKNNQTISGVPLSNFGGESFASISLTDALTHSVNTVFGKLGEKLGKKTMYDYMRRFGFNQKPPLDYPKNQLFASGVYNKGKLLSESDPVDIGRVAIGQERLQVTPLQMAMVASAVANGGSLMRPHFMEKVIGPDGRVKDSFGAQEQSRVMSQKSASELTQMMQHVVESGTGTGAKLQGIDVAGKTGTAEAPGGFNDAWFISFAPAKNPKVAVAVVVEHAQQSQTGGEVAAPLAAQVMRVLLSRNG